MGNLQTVLPPAKEAKKVINKIKEKEVSFNQEVCQEASVWLSILEIVQRTVKAKVQEYNRGKESWKNTEITPFEELCMICQTPAQFSSATEELNYLPNCISCHRKICDSCYAVLLIHKSKEVLCYPCIWRRKVAQITGEWFDDSLVKTLYKQEREIEDKEISLMPCSLMLTYAEKIFLSKVVFTNGAVELKLKYTPNLNKLEVLLIAAYNLSCSASITLNPVVKIALLLSDSNNQMEIQESETMYDTRNPQWASAFDFEVYGDNMSEKKLAIIVANEPGSSLRKIFIGEVIISLCDTMLVDNTPHIMKLSNQTSLDSILPSSRVPSRRGSLSSHEQTNKKSSGGSSRGRYTAPVFSMDSFVPHDLHNAKRAPYSYMSDDNLFTDSDSFTSASSGDDEATDSEDVYPTSSADSSPNNSRSGKIGSIAIHCKQKPRRRGSREQRKSLMHQMHVARHKKDKMGVQRSISEEFIPRLSDEYKLTSVTHRCSSAENMVFDTAEDKLRYHKLHSSVWIQPKYSETEHCGVVELSLLYSESDSQLVATLHSANDFPMEIEKSSSYLLKLTVKGQKMSQSHTATCYVQSPTFECRFLFNGVNKSKDILQLKLYYKRSKLIRKSKLGTATICLQEIAEDLATGCKREYKLSRKSK
ncbi:uncharacterized protein [Dysidea avara]|uniref:uncharacterized protein n=1 Tax=Dysidea avara TaxID=196820 RepID=UPI0033231D65